MSTDQLTGQQLAELNQTPTDLQSPEEMQVAQLEQQLEDPNTPPQIRDQILQQLDLAARRQFGGIGM